MRYARQNVLLEHCPQDAFAYTHGTPAEPSRWQSADAGALHLQAVTVPDLPACCTEHSHSYRFIEKDATITAVVAAAEPRRQQIVANAIELAEELERTPDAAFCAELAAELRAAAAGPVRGDHALRGAIVAPWIKTPVRPADEFFPVFGGEVRRTAARPAIPLSGAR